ncbi:NUDIX hydrolase [Ulvibacterium sp.]|uniref:NUDIX hydrolase n=1 Tax=Ulvibacterium sp. TaxID=2665914 RepID=UPI003BA8A003
MDFDLFSQQLSKIKNLPLPGEASHFKMAPETRIRLMQEARQKGKNPKRAAVMALFYPDINALAHLLLILRKAHPKDVHSGQVGFPGGQSERTDADLRETALRETHEEVGIPSTEIEIIRSLSEVYIPPSNFEVQPYIGLYQNREPLFAPQQSEVEALVEVPVTDFMDDSKIFMKKLSTSYAINIDVPAFNLNGYTVWGATAMMLSEIKELLKQVL